jgi:hypothetical protein
MEAAFKSTIWQQFGAAIDMLEAALRACPDPLWQGRLWDTGEEQPEWAQFWYLGFHALFWLDFYLSGSKEGFAPPAPFTLDEFDPAGLLPERLYTREELQTYLEYGRRKCQATIEGMTDEQAHHTYQFPWGELPFVELLLYNMRHVQEHAAQLSLFLGQQTGSGPGWVAKAKSRGG